MDRRRFLLTSLAGALGAPVAAEAQERALPLVAVVQGAYAKNDILPSPLENVATATLTFDFKLSHDHVRDVLRDAGYIDGRSIRIVPALPDQGEPLGPILSKLIQSGARVIVAIGTPATLAAKASTKTIPIVMAGVGDPVGSGIVRSLRRPGGNITGTSFLAPEITAKGLELLREVKPKTSRVAILRNPANPAAERAMTHTEQVAHQLGLTVLRITAPVASPRVDAFGASGPRADFRPVFATLKQNRSDALLVVNDPLFFDGVMDLAHFATRDGIPTVFQGKHYVEGGGLMAYHPNPDELFRTAGALVVKILKGARPSDLPVEQPTKFDLVINLKTAKALGLMIPQSLLLRAEQVIE